MKIKHILIALAAAPLLFTGCKSDKSSEDTEEVSTVDKVDKVDKVDTPTEEAPAVIELTDDAAYRPDKKVDVLTILDFNATWCGPCKEFGPTFKKAASKYTRVVFVSVDVDNNPETAAAFGIEGIPDVAFITPDGEVSHVIGTGELLPEEKFFQLVESKLK